LPRLGNRVAYSIQDLGLHGTIINANVDRGRGEILPKLWDVTKITQQTSDSCWQSIMSALAMCLRTVSLDAVVSWSQRTSSDGFASFSSKWFFHEERTRRASWETLLSVCDVKRFTACPASSQQWLNWKFLVKIPLSLHCKNQCNAIVQTYGYLPSLSWYSLHLPKEGWPGWVDLDCWLHTEIVYPPNDGHPLRALTEPSRE